MVCIVSVINDRGNTVYCNTAVYTIKNELHNSVAYLHVLKRQGHVLDGWRDKHKHTDPIILTLERHMNKL